MVPSIVPLMLLFPKWMTLLVLLSLLFLVLVPVHANSSVFLPYALQETDRDEKAPPVKPFAQSVAVYHNRLLINIIMNVNYYEATQW